MLIQPYLPDQAHTLISSMTSGKSLEYSEFIQSYKKQIQLGHPFTSRPSFVLFSINKKRKTEIRMHEINWGLFRIYRSSSKKKKKKCFLLHDTLQSQLQGFHPGVCVDSLHSSFKILSTFFLVLQ